MRPPTPMVIRDAVHAALLELDLRSTVALPLIVEQRLIGVLGNAG